jgi:hypothetical protein
MPGRFVEKTGRTLQEAVDAALADLGIDREAAEVLHLHLRDRDPGADEPQVTVRVSEKAAEPEPFRVQPVVCEKSAPTVEEAIKACLCELGIDESGADIQVVRTADGETRVTVRAWRRHLTEPAPVPNAPGSDNIHEIHAAAHLPEDGELDFEAPGNTETETR